MPSRTALIESAKNRASENPGKYWERATRHGPNAYECPYCGRRWEVTPSHGTSCSGFIASASDSHVSVCATATPAERRAVADQDEARWRRDPPVHRVWNDRSHDGFKD